MNSDSYSTVRFSTADIPEKERTAMWREHYCRVQMKLDIEPLNDAPLDCSILTRPLPGVQLMSTSISPSRIVRTREVLADGNDDMIFIINQSGSVTANSRGREVKLTAGDALLMSASDPKVFDRHSRGGSISFRIPRSILSMIVADVDEVVMRPIPGRTEVLTLLAGYAAPLFGDVSLSSTEFRRTAINHLHDLVALSLGAAHDADGLINGRGLSAARLRVAKTFIIDNSSRRDLSIGAVAAHLRLAPRNLQRLFESNHVLGVSAVAAAQSCVPDVDRIKTFGESGWLDRIRRWIRRLVLLQPLFQTTLWRHST